MTRAIPIFVCLVALLAAAPARGGILTSEYESQVECWLGTGDQTFKLIYEKKAGDTSETFHSKVDGKGATIVLMNVYDSAMNFLATVGGYNPRSWQSFGSYNASEEDADRTAFIFNLTTSTRMMQRLKGDGEKGDEWGNAQTYNSDLHGPTFGAGHDMYVFTSMNEVQFVQYSYGIGGGPSLGLGINLLGNTGWTTVNLGELEVYTFGPPEPPPAAPTASTPEPASLAIWGLGALGFTLAGYRKRRRAA